MKHSGYQDIGTLKVKICIGRTMQTLIKKKADMDILSNKVDLRVRNIAKDRHRHYIMIKW